MEEALSRVKESDLEKASRLYKAKTGVGCDGFHPKVPLDVTEEWRGGIVECLEKVEQSGLWPQQACTTMFFLILKNVTSERPIALMPTLIPWWEASRAPEVATWQQKYRVESMNTWKEEELRKEERRRQKSLREADGESLEGDVVVMQTTQQRTFGKRKKDGGKKGGGRSQSHFVRRTVRVSSMMWW